MMPSVRFLSRLLWALVALGFLSSLCLLSDRQSREGANRQVEGVLDYRCVVDLARSQGVPVDDLLARFRSYGIRSLAVDEQTLDDLAFRGKARALPGLALADVLRPGQVPVGVQPRPDCLYLVASDPQVASELREAAAASLGAARVNLWPAPGSSLVELKGDPRNMDLVGLGIPADLVRHLHGDLGFRLWLRPENSPGAPAPQVEARLRSLAALPGVEGLVFAGARNEALGYPDQLDLVARLLGELHLKVGLIEGPEKTQQKGIETLARQATAQVVRVMAIPPAQQARLHPEVAVAMYSLGARERNIRLLYLRPYADIVEELPVDQANALLFQGIRSDLGPMLADQASTFPPARGGWMVPWILAAVGAGAATVLLVSQVVALGPGSAALVLLALAAGTAVTALTGLFEHPWRALMALGTATVFPVLGLALQLPALERAAAHERPGLALWTGTRALLAASAFSLVGGLMAASFLPETTYMLSLDIFRGVKLHSLLVPLLVMALWASRQSGLGAAVRFLETRVRVWHLLVLLALAALGAVYVARTGNVTGELAVSDSERVLRRWLDAALGVRPRFKEFLLGNPALVLAPLLACLRWRGLVPFALLAAAVGQASLSDTYAHIHTPLPISLVRTGLGVGVGWALGLIGSGVLLLAHRFLAPLLAGLGQHLDREPAQGVEEG